MPSVTMERLVGTTICLLGLAVCLHSYFSFDLGTLRRIGPGMFPFGLGLGLTLLGLGIAVMAPDRERKVPDFSVRTMLLVLAGVGAFAVLVSPFGLFIAIIASVMVTSLAEQPFKPKGAILVAFVLCVLSWVIFKVGLGLAFPMFRWPL